PGDLGLGRRVLGRGHLRHLGQRLEFAVDPLAGLLPVPRHLRQLVPDRLGAEDGVVHPEVGPQVAEILLDSHQGPTEPPQPLQIADRANIVLRVLAGLAASGVSTVLVMPDRKGITSLLERNLARERNLGRSLPEVRILDMAVTTTVDDTLRATAAMVDAGVAA